MSDREDFSEITARADSADRVDEVRADTSVPPKKSPAAGGFSVHFKTLARVFRKDSAPNLILTLTLFTLITALALGCVYQVTNPIILESEEKAVSEAMEQVLPASLFEKAAFDENVYIGRGPGGEVLGYAVRVAPAGYGGPISMIVGVDTKGAVTGIVIVSHSETPGLGSRVKSDAGFLEQFVGKGANASVGSGIDAITSATISSKAVTAGVREAVGRVLGIGTIS